MYCSIHIPTYTAVDVNIYKNLIDSGTQCAVAYKNSTIKHLINALGINYCTIAHNFPWHSHIKSVNTIYRHTYNTT